MIFRHYRRRIPSLQVGAGRRMNRLFEKTLGVTAAIKVSLKPSLSASRKTKCRILRAFPRWRRGELNRQPDSGAFIGKVLDSPAKPRPFTRCPEHEVGPKTAGEDPEIPEKPDLVRSIESRRGNREFLLGGARVFLSRWPRRRYCGPRALSSNEVRR
jgi:hypothetical protein